MENKEVAIPVLIVGAHDSDENLHVICGVPTPGPVWAQGFPYFHKMALTFSDLSLTHFQHMFVECHLCKALC